MKTNLNQLAQYIDIWAESKGWHDKKIREGDFTALAHTEISEAYESYRNGEALVFERDGKPEGAAVEYMDALIRILHWMARHNIDADQVFAMKMAYNEGRPYRHGGKVA